MKSVKELIDLAKSKPDQLSFASSGVATGTHLSGELFKVLALTAGGGPVPPGFTEHERRR